MHHCTRLIPLAAVLLLVVPVRAQKAPTVQKEMQTVYAQLDRLTAARDVDGLGNWLATEYSVITATGTRMDRETYLSVARANVGSAEAVKCRSVLLGVRVSGPTTVARVRTYTSMTLTDADTRRHGTQYSDVIAQDQWRKKNGQWLLVRSQVIQEKAKFVPD